MSQVTGPLSPIILIIYRIQHVDLSITARSLYILYNIYIYDETLDIKSTWIIIISPRVVDPEILLISIHYGHTSWLHPRSLNEYNIIYLIQFVIIIIFPTKIKNV